MIVRVRRHVAAVSVCLAVAACGAGQDAAVEVERGPSSSAPTATGASTSRPGEAPSDSPSATPASTEPLTTVPDAVMLTPDVERIEDRGAAVAWRAAYCTPEPGAPSGASAMRTRAWRGPAPNPEVGPLEYAQQVAAFPSVEAAVAAAAQLVAAADSCNAGGSPAGPTVTQLPLGTQARLVVFAEGGDYSIRGFFRRANAIASVQGSGDSDAEVREALNETFARLCIYERPDGC